jgi:N-acetylglucosamine-6-phosphate deacetylase
MIVISGAVLVLPDRVVDEGSVLVEGDRVVAIEPRIVDPPQGAECIDAAGGMIVPGFIDVHVHGVEGIDVLDGPGAVAKVAARLPRYGVTSFCPTTVACAPGMLDTMLLELAGLLEHTSVSATIQSAARVLPAHLESNFISPEYKGAQPEACLRTARGARPPGNGENAFSGADVLRAIERRREQIAIVTVAPEIEGGLELVSQLAAAGHRVSIGHTGATYEQAIDAIAAGVCHATHLFNRMTPMTHRAPGVPGAVLDSDAVAAELICDGVHVHPTLLRLAIRAKGIGRVMAITDGTAGSGLPVGSRARLGGRPIIVTERTAELEDGTIAGSVLTMDVAFRLLVGKVGLSVVEAATICAATPARQLGLVGSGQLAPGAPADLVILERKTLRVRSTMVRGAIWAPPAEQGNLGRSALV